MTTRFVLNRLLVVGAMLYVSIGASMAACLSGDALRNAAPESDPATINEANDKFTSHYKGHAYKSESIPADLPRAIADQYTADATFAGTLQPYWLEGRTEIQDLWLRYFAAWPNRNIEFRHRRLCTYGNSAVETGFIEMYMGAQNRETVITYIRYSRTWVKLGAVWKIANMNVGRMPGN